MACSAKTLLQQNSELMNQLIDVSLGGGGGDGEEDTAAGGVHLCFVVKCKFKSKFAGSRRHETEYQMLPTPVRRVPNPEHLAAAVEAPARSTVAAMQACH